MSDNDPYWNSALSKFAELRMDKIEMEYIVKEGHQGLGQLYIEMELLRKDMLEYIKNVNEGLVNQL